MTREEKSQVIEDLTAQLADNPNIYLTDISGLNAGVTSDLRRACFKANIKLAVVKNTLLAKAMEASDKEFGELPSDIARKRNIVQQLFRLRGCLAGSVEFYNTRLRDYQTRNTLWCCTGG